MAAPYPPTVSYVIAFGDNLYPVGPVPLPVAEGGHASVVVYITATAIIDIQSAVSPWRTCPPPDRGRGRGPTTASLSEARTTMALGGAGVSEANGVPTGANCRWWKKLEEVIVDGEDADGAEEAGGLELRVFVERRGSLESEALGLRNNLLLSD